MNDSYLYHSYSEQPQSLLNENQALPVNFFYQALPVNFFYMDDSPIWMGSGNTALSVPEAFTRSSGAPQMNKISHIAHLAVSKLAVSFAVVGLLLLIVSFGPNIVYSISSNLRSKEATLNLSQTEANSLSTDFQIKRSDYTPPVNTKLPKTNRLVIKALGVNTIIEEAPLEKYETALRKGVWRVSDFGAPNVNKMPTILAAHRFGYLAWSNLYRRQNSFYNLPKLKVGEIVEIDWMQRKYQYEVYAESKGTEITDYTADLILYTCVDLSGPERVFKYGRLMEI